MPNKRDLKLDKYGIDIYLYRELKNFCLRYPNMKRQIVDLHNPLHAMNYDGMPHNLTPGEPTAMAAEKAAALSKHCELIEQTAIEADSGIYQWLLLAVTEGIAYEELGYVPCGRRKFYEVRRKFFYLLSLQIG